MNHTVHDLAFWRDNSASKQSSDISSELEQWAKSGQEMSALSLHRAPLQRIDLVAKNKTGYDMRNTDLYRANLSQAHLFSVDLRGGSLMKADLTDANLHCAKLEDCNLLGTKLDNAKLDNIQWGNKVLQEKLAEKAEQKGKNSLALDYYQQAEEVYRNLRIQLEKAGLFKESGDFFYREMLMRRMQIPRLSLSRFRSFIIDQFCGYGEKPLRVVSFSLSIILSCTFVYFLTTSIVSSGNLIGFNSNHSLITNIRDFFSCLYFSVVTFTTLGYGDLTPQGIARVMAALEAFTGSFTMALFVVVFVKKMTR